MNREQLADLKRKFEELWRAALTEHNRHKLSQGNTLHMTIKLGGPFELWFEGPKDSKNPLSTPSAG